MNEASKTLKQLRIARRLGRITAQQQERIVRRKGLCKSDRWKERCQRIQRTNRLWSMRDAIADDVAPIIKTKREVEWAVFDIRFVPDEPVVETVSARIEKPPIAVDADWWKTAK